MSGLLDFMLPASNPQDPNAILSPDEVTRRQALADAMMKQGMDYSPVQSPWQGAARLADGLFGGLQTHRDQQMAQAGRASATSDMAPLLAQLLRGGQMPAGTPSINDIAGSGAPAANGAPPNLMEGVMGAAPTNGQGVALGHMLAGGPPPTAQPQIQPTGNPTQPQPIPAAMNPMPNQVGAGMPNGAPPIPNSNPQANAGITAAPMAYPGPDGITKADITGAYSPNQQVASAAPASAPAAAAPAASPASGPMGSLDPQILARVLNNQWATPQQQQVVSALLQHQMTLQDPANKLALEKAQVDLQNAEHPELTKMTPFQHAIVDSRSAPDAPKTTSEITNYEYGQTHPGFAAANADTPDQDKLEQQFRPIVAKEFSNRSGGLGLQDAKVNQAIHLRALVDQYKQTDAQGNVVYNIPTSQYHELAMGLASLISPTGTTSDADRKEINAKTAAGDINGLVQYITGAPQNGNTQDMTKNLIDSIDRQGSVAEDERATYLKAIKDMAPTSLDPKRRDAIMGSGLNSFKNRPGATAADPLAKARAAIANGADPAMVKKRLQYNGIDASGL